MRAVAAYMASKYGRENEERRSEYGGAESREYRNDRQRQPNQYTARNGEEHDTPMDAAEMRRRRDSKGRYMTGDDGMHDDVRAYDARYEHQPMRDNYGRVESRYMPDYPIAEPRGGLYDGGGIGFGTRDNDYQTRSHYEVGGDRQAAQVGGTMWMEPITQGRSGGMMELDRETAERWMQSLRNEDPNRASGPRWSMDEVKPMAQKFGYREGTPEFIEFWAMTNAMYSDYCMVAKKFNITSPEYYGMMAKAWMEDKDAMPGKTAMYYQYIVKK